MAKFTIQVDVDWINEDETLDTTLRGEVVSAIVARFEKTIDREAKALVASVFSAHRPDLAALAANMLDKWATTPIYPGGPTPQDRMIENFGAYLNQTISNTTGTRLDKLIRILARDFADREMAKAETMIEGRLSAIEAAVATALEPFVSKD